MPWRLNYKFIFVEAIFDDSYAELNICETCRLFSNIYVLLSESVPTLKAAIFLAESVVEFEVTHTRHVTFDLLRALSECIPL
jgi:hypothetical protein